MARITHIRCTTKQSDGSIVNSYLGSDGVTRDQAAYDLLTRCPKYDTEREATCYTLDGGATVLPGGKLVETYAVDPDTGLPNLVPVQTAVFDSAGAELTLSATVYATACPVVPDVEPRVVCIDTTADGLADTDGIQRIVYALQADGSISQTVTLTLLDAVTPVTGDVVKCPEVYVTNATDTCLP